MAATVPIEQGQMTMPRRALRARRGQRAPIAVGKTRMTEPPVAARGVAQGVERSRCRTPSRSSRRPWLEAMSQTGHVVAGEHLEQPDAVGGARGAGEREHDGKPAHRPRRLGVGERTGCFTGAGGAGRRGGRGDGLVREDFGPRLRRRLTRDGPPARRRRPSRLITPFMVKKAASSRERSPGRTRRCS